ncbi:FRG domain-containing protein [Bacillus wiedmannii]|uniref:FRG domain-containing protein n=1 Tax=Bacillus wiedmannii TaxID=1890302 RepID=UPI000BFD0E50|nr:FRG domain-containing protein [Bacillus wiedmannii]PHD29926.1 FRG domain-containing protein [Bacillus wiedmannii]
MEQANSIAEFNKIIERYKIGNNLSFRGQGAKYPSITSSIARDRGYVENEPDMYAEAIRMKQDEFDQLTSPIQDLAKLQHYNVPTRLIDITSDARIALFFAIQNVENREDAYVYVYSQENHKLSSKNVRILSLLATLKENDLETIRQQYKNQFNEEILDEEIISMAQSNVFVEFAEELKDLNLRLYKQKGSFVICGNVVRDGEIQRELKTLDGVEPVIIIKIPFEYKETIKKELDEKYDINEAFIYPELPSVGSYVREKYKYSNFSGDNMYSLMEEDNRSHAGAKRISLVIVLNEAFGIEKIKQAAKELMRKYQATNNVIWIYVAKNGNDYIMRNWILRGQWIDDKLPERYKPMTISEIDDEGYFWVNETGYSVRGDFYNKHIFEDDKVLFAKYQNSYKKALTIYNQLQTAFENNQLDLFKQELNKQAEKIRGIYFDFTDFGRSTDKEFGDFLHNYQEFIAMFDNILVCNEMKHLNEMAWKSQITSCFQDANKSMKLIDSESEMWKEKMNVTDKELQEISYTI